ncbi:MAG: TonB-dependent receptor [Gammaproteobacteria bacterium]|nr:TonB-dependent receptor [Gammaproteobacteria bacterium]
MNLAVLARGSAAIVMSVMSIWPGFVSAQAVNEAAVEAAIEPIDVVTIIGRAADTADVPGSAHIIDAEDLATFNQSDILRVLRAVPGVYVQEEEGFGLRPNIGIRGSGLDRSARIALLEDGVLIAPAPYAASSAYYFPTQRRMHAIEVLKGLAAVAVGPRTTGGAINMISTPIPDDISLNADIRAGDNHARDAHINAGNRGERVSWLIETVQASSDGFKTIDAPATENTGFELKDYVGKLQVDSDARSRVYQSLRLKLGFNEQDADATYLGLTHADFEIDPYRRYAASANDNFVGEHKQAQATYVIDPGKLWRGEVTAYQNDFERNWYKLQSVAGSSLSDILDDPSTYANEYGYLTGISSPDDSLQVRANNRSYYSKGIQGRIEWNLGIADTEVMLNTGFRVHEDQEDRFQHQDGYRMQDGLLVLTSRASAGSQSNRISTANARSFFVDAEIHAGHWVLAPGIRYEDIDLERLDFSTADPTRANGPTRIREDSLSVVIPGFGALYRLSDDWRLLAGIHKGYNPPAAGSSADAETSINVELGTRFDNGSWRMEGIYFVNDYDNLVGTVTESTGGGGQIGDQFEGGEAVVSGVELSVGSELAFRTFKLPFDLRYTWTIEAEFENAFESDFDPWGDVQAGDELPYIPEHQLRATAGIDIDRFRVNLGASYVDKMRTRATQGAFEPDTTVDSHIVWDIVGTWDFASGVSAYVKVDNLFDEAYVASTRPAGLRPGLPRTAYVGIQYSL